MEFGRAVLERLLQGGGSPDVYYCGFLREDQKDCIADFEAAIYSHWDSSATAPAKTRPSEAKPDPTLDLLTWVSGRPKFPDALLNKFSEGSASHKVISEFKQELLRNFPEAGADASVTASPSAGTVRAQGQPDYSIEGGARPQDLSEDLNLAVVKEADFKVTRTGGSPKHIVQFLFRTFLPALVSQVNS